FGRVVRFEIADGRSGEINDAARRHLAGQRQFEGFEIIGSYRKDLKLREHFAKPLRGFFQLLPGNIDWDINQWIAQFCEQDPGFSSGASAETDQLDLTSERFSHLRAVQSQNLNFGAGDVILGKIADLAK